MNDLPVRSLSCDWKLRNWFESTNQVGRSVDETLRLVQAFQYTEEHGEGMQKCWVIFLVLAIADILRYVYKHIISFTVCPAGWTPGGKTVSILSIFWTPARTKVFFLPLPDQARSGEEERIFQGVLCQWKLATVSASYIIPWNFLL